MNIFLFRVFVLVVFSLYVLSVAYPLLIKFDEGTAFAESLKWNTYGAYYIPHPVVIFVIILLTMLATISLLFLSKLGRLICTVMVAIEVLLSFFTGIVVLTPLESFLGSTSCLLMGAILAYAWYA